MNQPPNDSSSPLRVVPFAGTPAEWDHFGRAQHGWTAFHRHALGDVIRHEFGHERIALAAQSVDGTVEGTLSLVRVKSPVFGHFLVSMPFVSYGGPLGTARAVRALTDHAEHTGEATNVDLLELRSAVALPIDLPVSHRKITAVLSLPDGGPDASFKAFKPKLRSQIRRPGKEGVTVRLGHDQIRAFHSVFSRHMRDLGTPTLPSSWFAALASAYGDDFWVAVAWHEGVPIACGAGFRWAEEFEITWASALREYNSISPNMAVYWALIERCAQGGLRRFNFGRCTPDSPTHRFKSQWGALDETLYWYHGRSGRASATPSPSGGGYSLATKVWRRLPLALANAIGPRVVRYIP